MKAYVTFINLATEESKTKLVKIYGKGANEYFLHKGNKVPTMALEWVGINQDDYNEIYEYKYV